MESYFYFNQMKIPFILDEQDNFMTLAFNYNKALIEEIKASTEARQWDGKHKLWRLKRTDRNYFVLDYLTGKKPYKRYDIPIPDDLINPEGLSHFWTHQNKMHQAILQRQQIIIAGEMRTGKTLPAIEAIRITKYDGAWWIAPKSAIRGLKIELQKWNFDLKIYLLTYDKFRSIYHGSPEVVPRFIVFDECQKLKNPKSKQGMKARDITSKQKEKYGDDRYAVGLSGTPAPKDPSDWWNLCETFCPGFLREGSHMALKQRLGEYEQREGQVGQKYWHLIGWKEKEVKYLHKRLKGLVEVFLKKDCLDLPEKMYEEIELPVSSMYRKAADMLHSSVTMPAILRNKLCQLSDGFQYISTPNEVTGQDDKSTHYFPDCPKDQQLKDDLDEYSDIGRVIVYCGFQATLDKIVKICVEKDWVVLKVDGRGWEALNTTKSVDELLTEMNRSTMTPEFDKLVFVAQSDSASTGLELSASSVAIYFSNSYNVASRMQSEDRPHSNNMDKERGYLIRDYIHIPVDKLVLDNLKTKKTLQGITMGDLSKVMEWVC